MPARAYIGLGANLGDAVAQVEAALRELSRHPSLKLVARSALYRSAPVDAIGPDFANAVASIDTMLTPAELLEVLQGIEARYGRERPFPNAPRTLDLDLLLHGNARLDSPTLTLPHPRLHLRAFVLRPLAELAPELTIPGYGPVASLLAGVADQAIAPWFAVP